MNKLTERTISGLHNSLVKFIPELELNTSVLDIGCGTGAWLERLADLGFNDLHGIDLNIQQFATSKATCSQANLDFDDLGLNDKKYGLITSIEVIEHLENPGRLFYHIHKHLDKDGYFLLTTPNIHSTSCRFKFFATGKLASFDEKGDPTHIYPVLLNSLERVLSRYSLKVVNQWGYPSKGSLIYQKPMQLISGFLDLFLPHEVPGDTLCLLIKHQSSSIFQ